jgi:hypothetical protein
MSNLSRVGGEVIQVHIDTSMYIKVVILRRIFAIPVDGTIGQSTYLASYDSCLMSWWFCEREDWRWTGEITVNIFVIDVILYDSPSQTYSRAKAHVTLLTSSHMSPCKSYFSHNCTFLSLGTQPNSLALTRSVEYSKIY